ncbi:MAG: hypothetical protein GWN67_08825 [Phycisphaerae bacterium]|nr:hypothetical protein [Phycisphaerae bacterium]NIR64185.1 hypothetical protein [candidate division Zixibacteria bacterium]NIP52189.1 hypothetical protein [Phycisphaerae bacterium]NIS51196.1 hypothetical protein [Phycisphaerae bacterium]NIU08866.1 hypothetical protein [Phycisphaerae bacterium]
MAAKTFLNNAREISLFLVILTFSAIVHAKIIYVDGDGPAGFNNIQSAIDDSNDGDIIIVKPGTYTGYGNRDIDFLGKAITVQSTDPNDPNIVDSTIIDCNHLGRGFFFHSGEDGNSILSGFTITNGQAPIGGGIYCENQSGPTIANCVIKSNTADGRESGNFGGGISGCKGTIINCTISGNTAGEMFYGSGGGLYDCNGTIINCIVSINRVRSGEGGGLSECNADIINCKILNNWVGDYSWNWMGHGGGLYRCNGRIINSTINDNVVVADGQAYGGGLYACNGPIINCTISGNEAHSDVLNAYGGGLDNCDGTISNCTIRQNSASGGSGDDESTSGYGGGLYGCDGTISNCTISDNRAEGGWALGGEYNWGCGGGLGGCDGNIINCTISYNMATVLGDSYYSGGAGGGFYGCNGTITNCKIIGNTAAYRGWYEQHAFGGGLRGFDETITDYTVIGDNASDTRGSEQRAFGGGLYSCDATISNCKISGNIALSEYDCFGGGLYNCDGMIFNCTISGNKAMITNEPAVGDAIGGGLYRCDGTITNCIIWANSANTGSQVYSSSEPNYCCLQDYTGSGTGNIDDDPLFTEPGYWDTNGVWIDGDYHLLLDSPCIDAGDPNYVVETNETDLEGKPRVMGGRIDMGAYESPIIAEARILPQTINLASKGKWVTCYIWLPDKYDVADIEPDNIFLEGQIQPEQFSIDQQKQVAVLRFSRSEVQGILDIGEVNLTITCQLTDGTAFEATGTIKVIDKAANK